MRESFGQVVMAIMNLPRYRHQSLGDLTQMVLEPLIRDQIKAGTFPIRLKPEDWQSGSINWLLDVIAPDRKTAGRVTANFGRVVKTGDLRLHPQIGGLVKPEMLEKMARPKAKESDDDRDRLAERGAAGTWTDIFL